MYGNVHLNHIYESPIYYYETDHHPDHCRCHRLQRH